MEEYTIRIIKTIKEMQAHAESMRQAGKIISFVPTMGFFHDGHLSLMQTGLKMGDEMVLSIFVNPAQFGPNEDLDTYPKNLERDLKLAEQQGVDIVYTPDAESLYPEEYQTFVSLETLPNFLCGISRPFFFRGVTTVVTKLFNIVKPHVAIFGEKDFQQLVIVKQMVKDLNFDLEIISAPTVREPDGLAMSSRNSYLTPDQRPAALTLYQSLCRARDLIEKGTRSVAEILESAARLVTSYPETEIDYIAVCDPVTLVDIETIDKPVLMAMAVKVGNTRLIDNMILIP